MLVGGNTAPNIVGIPKRSRFSSLDEDRAISKAMLAARGNIHPCPVLHGGRIIGFVRGKDVFSDLVYFKKVPVQYQMAWSDYTNIITSLTGSNRLSILWHKTPTTSGIGLNWYDLWPCIGSRGAGTLAGTAHTANKYTDTDTGAIFTGGDKSPNIKYVMSAWASASANTPTFLLYDRVLDYQSCAYNANSNQAMTNTNTAQRYIASGQSGLQMTWGTDTVHSSTASNITQLQYTDNDGNATQSMPTSPTVSIIVSGAAGGTTLGSRMVAPATSGELVPWGAFMPLASGDTGARLVANFTTSAANTGTFVLAMVYPLAYIPCGTINGISYFNEVFNITPLERIYDGAAVCVMSHQTVTTGYSATGVIDVGWG